ncbi:MAG: hypothetical protein OXC26_22320 [Albidovulum sp.]|nr:hypothetical protein [Albidovulum sp.]
MTTTGIDSWAVDLADVGAIYPFQGTEWLWLIIGLVAWIGWHVWCINWEKSYQEDKVREYGSKKKIEEALNDD